METGKAKAPGPVRWLARQWDTLLLVGFILFVLSFADPAMELAFAHPWWALLVLALVFSLTFSIDTLRDWRRGTSFLGPLRDRLSGPRTEPGRPMPFLWVLLAGLALVWFGVSALAIQAVEDLGQKAVLILVLGGVSVLALSPLLLFPALLIFGAFLPRQRQVIRFTLTAPSIPRDALLSRADLGAMPAIQGTAPAVSQGEDWRAAPITLGTILLRHGITYRISRATEGMLTMEARTDAGDREVTHLTRTADGTIAAEVTCEGVGRWSRATMRAVGPAGHARLVSTIEAARMTRMTGMEMQVTALSPGSERDG